MPINFVLSTTSDMNSYWFTFIHQSIMYILLSPCIAYVRIYCILGYSSIQISADCDVLNILASFAFFIVQTLILILVWQCSTRLATCNFSENELIAKSARVSRSLKLPGIQYRLTKKCKY